MISMAKQDVIDALKFYGGRATQPQITAYLKSKNHSGYCSAVLQRLKKWHEVKMEKAKGAHIWILNEDGY
jgi:hypothetical protein